MRLQSMQKVHGDRTGKEVPRMSPRALFYSHDTLGLGHLSRTLLISQGLTARIPELSAMILTGSPMAHAFRVNPSVDYVKLPSVRKLRNEEYASRVTRLSFKEVWTLRQRIILETARTYQPDLFFVDNVPCGMGNEVVATLRYLKRYLPNTRVLLILRDILDDAKYIVPFWRRSRVFPILEEYYHRVFICGSPEIYDAVNEYCIPASISARTRFCGYIPRSFAREKGRTLRNKLCQNGEKMLLVTVGGGSDGANLLESYFQALPIVSQKVPVASLVLLGPELGRTKVREFKSRYRKDPKVELVDFCPDVLARMQEVDLVVSMAGYNTTSEIVWLRKKAIVIPRVSPRAEQLIRAKKLEGLGLLQMIHPGDLGPDRLAARIIENLKSPPSFPKSTLPFTAIERLSREIAGLLQECAQHRREIKQRGAL